MKPDARAASEAAEPTAARHYEALLTQVMATPLDADYARVAKERGATATPPTRSGTRVAFWGVVLAFGILIGVSALKTEQDQPIAEAERAELIDQVRQRQDTLDDLHDRLATLQRAVTSSQEKLSDETSSNRQLSDRLQLLAQVAGTAAVTGPGVSITVDDAPDVATDTRGIIVDTDLQILTNALWEAGAEAIAIDGHRLTSLTSIRYAGQAITVDYRSLTAPYVIEAIGDRETLPADLARTDGGRLWSGLASNLGVRYDVNSDDNLTLPADPHERFLYAQPSGGGR